MKYKSLLSKYKVESGRGRNVLTVGLLTVCALIFVQSTHLLVNGPGSSTWKMSLTATVGMLPVNIVLLLFDNRLGNKSVPLYLWSIVCATLFLLGYYTGEYPHLVATLPLVCIVGAYNGGFRRTIVLLVVCVLTLCYVGIVYDLGNAIPNIILCIVGSGSVGKLRDDLMALVLATRIMLDGKTRN